MPPDTETMCPTCGGTGPDIFALDYDSGWIEARCGDEWHDQFDGGADHAS